MRYLRLDQKVVFEHTLKLKAFNDVEIQKFLTPRMRLKNVNEKQ